MITPAYAATMARYNRWQNRSIYAAAAGLDDAARKQDRGRGRFSAVRHRQQEGLRDTVARRKRHDFRRRRRR